MLGILRRQLRLPRLGREHVWAALGYAALAVLFFRSAIFEGRILYRRDINMVWLPQAETFVRCIAQGSWPLWDPFAGFGRPLLADPRAEILYPPTWLNLVMWPGSYYTLFVVLHLVFSGLGLFALARRWGVSPPAAFAAGAVWIASGPFLSLASMWHHLAAAAWIPWLFLTADIALDSGRFSHALLWGATLAGQVFAGSPDLTALTLPVLALYVLVRRPSWRSSPGPARHSPLSVALLAFALGLGLSAIQWLPMLEWALRSSRPDLPYWLRTTWSLHPISLVEIVVPLSWSGFPLSPALWAAIGTKEPWLHSIYLGLPCLALAAAGLLSGRPRRFYLLAVATATVLFSLGRHSVFYDAATLLLPPLRMLRFPVKAMPLAAFAVSLLAGMGLDDWRPWRSRATAWSLVVLGPVVLVMGLALAGTLAAAFRAETWGRLLLAPAPLATLGALLAPAVGAFALTAALSGAVLLLAVARGRVRTRLWSTAALAALALGALVAAHRDLHWTARREPLALRPPVISVLEQQGFPRLYVYDYSIMTRPQLQANRWATDAYRLAGIPSGWSSLEATVFAVHSYLNPPTAARWGLAGSFDRDILGFDPVPLARLNEFLRRSEETPIHLRLLRMAGVHNALALVPGAWWKDLAPVAAVESLFARPIQVFRVPDPLPRTYVVGGVRVADGEAAQAVLAEAGFDPTRELLLPEGTPRQAPASAPGSSRILEMKPDRVRIEADLREPAYVVLLDAYDPGWRATLDGRRTQLLRANVAFRAVHAPAGRHVIDLVYRPASVTVGLLVSLVTALAGALGIAARRRALR